MKYEYKQLRVTDLLLNVENPRFDPVEHQTQAIQSMIDDQGEKLIELAKHIAKNGLNPMEIILVQPSGKQWLVREGNRRVTALKLLNEPELIPDSKQKYKHTFSELSKNVDNSILDNIFCVVASDEESINEWILLKHTGENRGVGTVSWSAQQTSRFASQVSGKKDPKLELFEMLRHHPGLPAPLREEFHKIKKTNFDRLFGDPAVRNMLGIETQGNAYALPRNINSFLVTILTDLTGDFRVGKIYSKSDRENYLEDVRIRATHTSNNNSHEDSDNENNDTPKNPVIPSQETPSNMTQSSNASKKANSTREINKKTYPINRKTLVSSIHKLAIGNPRVARIFNELKNLDCEQFPNAVSALFRVFIELSCDCYISAKELKGINVDSKLSLKIESVANDIENKKLMTKNELRSARQMATSQTQNQSVRTFHSYVHNKDFTPIAHDLIVAWDDIWNFIETMWR